MEARVRAVSSHPSGWHRALLPPGRGSTCAAAGASESPAQADRSGPSLSSSSASSWRRTSLTYRLAEEVSDPRRGPGASAWRGRAGHRERDGDARGGLFLLKLEPRPAAAARQGHDWRGRRDALGTPAVSGSFRQADRAFMPHCSILRAGCATARPRGVAASWLFATSCRQGRFDAEKRV